jgi:hypothetical protein
MMMMKKKTKTATKAEPKKATKKTKKMDAPKPAEATVVKRPRGRPRKSPKLVTEEKPLSKPSDFVMAFPEEAEFQRGLAAAFEKAAEEQRLEQLVENTISALEFDQQRQMSSDEALTVAKEVIEDHAVETPKADITKVLDDVQSALNDKEPTAVASSEPSPEAEADLQSILGLTVPFTLPWYKRWWLAVLRFFN